MQQKQKKIGKNEKKNWKKIKKNGKKRERREETIAVLVEQAEGFLELRDLIVCELICHFKRERERKRVSSQREREICVCGEEI